MSNDNTFKNLVAQVKAAHSIVDYVQGVGISLKRSSAQWKGLCPFHNEKTPSFNVRDDHQSFHCFGCGAKGDIVTFVMMMDHLDFRDAVIKLGEEKGIEVNFGNTVDDGVDYKSLRACIRDAANFFFKNFMELPESHPARKQLADRDLEVDPKSGFLYGYAPEGYDTTYKFLKSKGYEDETIFATGVAKASQSNGKIFDFWRGRLMFFISDASGRPVGFSGRKLFENDTMGKYVNSPDGPLFNKSEVLFNQSVARKTAGSLETIYVCEGQFDIAAMVAAGMSNAVASSGTAFTEKQGQLCRRMVGEKGKIVFAFDGDEAGIAAALKVFKNVPAIHAQSYAVVFPGGADPCDYRRDFGDEALVEFVTNNQKPLVDFVLETERNAVDMETPMGQSQYVSAAASVLKSITVSSLREAYVRRVSLDALISADAVREAVANAKPLSPERRAEELVEAQPTPGAVRMYETAENLEVTQEEVIQTLGSTVRGEMISRLVILSANVPFLRPRLLELCKYAPSQLVGLMEEVASKDFEDGLVIAERYDNTEAIQYLLDAELFPLGHLMTQEQNIELFDHLYHELETSFLEHQRDVASKRILNSLLADGAEKDISLLSEAIRREELENASTVAQA